MEAILQKQGFDSFQQTYTRSIRKDESQDCVVPDTMSDIAALTATWGSVLIRSKDVAEGRVRVEANVPARISFLPEGETRLCCLEVNIPLYFSAEDASIREDTICVADLTLRSLETRMLNPRKITVRAEVELTLECYMKAETAFYTLEESEGSFIHARQRNTTVSAVDSVTEKTFVLTDELSLQGDQPAAESILGQQTTIGVEDIKAVGTKLVIKGCANSMVLYQSPDGETATASFLTEFSQIADMGMETEDAYSAAKLLLSGAYCDVAPGCNGRTLRLELHAVAQLTMYGAHQIDYMTDAYSNAYALSLQRTPASLRYITGADVLRTMVREELTLPAVPTEVLCCAVACLGAQLEADGLRLDLRAQLLCRGADEMQFGAEAQWSARIPSEPSDHGGMLLRGVILKDVSAVPAGSGVELRCTAEVSVLFAEEREQDCICGIAYDDAELPDLSDKPSLVIMRVSSTDDLWQLARENCSTTAAICSANHLEEETGAWEKLLLIPRTL